MTFWALFDYFHFKNIEMTIFSGINIFWRLLGEYYIHESLSVLYCYCKGLSSGSAPYGPKIGQNYTIHDFWALFDHFHFEKDINEFIFW